MYSPTMLAAEDATEAAHEEVQRWLGPHILVPHQPAFGEADCEVFRVLDARGVDRGVVSVSFTNGARTVRMLAFSPAETR